MISSTIFAALSPFISLASADYSIAAFQATDIYVPSDSHFVNFNVSQPGAPWELGGDAVSKCSISWKNEVPKCYSRCNPTEFSGEYFARICPGSFEGAGQLAIELIETWFYKAPDAGNTTHYFDYTDPETGYWCSTGAQTKICSQRGNVTAERDFGMNPYETIDVCGE